MVSVIILDKNEPNVVKLTYQNLWKELKDIPSAELLVETEWLDAKVKNRYVCYVEPDCLVSSGYFKSQIGLFEKNPMFRKLAMLSSSTGVNNWANKFYGYSVGNNHSDGVIPNKEKRSTAVYPVQIGYLPGSLIRYSMLKDALNTEKVSSTKDTNLVNLSTMISLAFWRQGDGNRVHLNPNATYVTTEDYVNDITEIEANAGDLVSMFHKESI